MPAQAPIAADRPLRKDAARNRRRLLAAARELFASQGPQITLHKVADRAGLGVGTAYRNFRGVNELVVDLVDARLDEISALIQEALEDPDAWRGLTGMLARVVQMQLEDRGLRETLGQHRISSSQRGRCAQTAPLLQELVERAKHQGTLRPDVEPSDLIFLQAGLAAGADDWVGGADSGLHRRYLNIILDGLRADTVSRSELPAPPLSLEQLP